MSSKEAWKEIAERFKIEPALVIFVAILATTIILIGLFLSFYMVGIFAPFVIKYFGFTDPTLIAFTWAFVTAFCMIPLKTIMRACR